MIKRFLSITTTTHTIQAHYTLKRKMIKITVLSPFVIKTPKRENLKKVQAPHGLVVVLRLLIVADIIAGSTSMTDAKSSQLSRSQ
jgi:hypothetical protein